MPQRRFLYPLRYPRPAFQGCDGAIQHGKKIGFRSATVWFRYRVTGNTVENFVARMSYHHRTRSIDLLPNTFCSTDVFPFLFAKRRSLCFITGKNVAPSFSSPGQTATGVRQAVISAPGPHWHAADRILHASVHAESPSTCTKALSACPEPRPDASMTACHGAEHPHGKPKPTYARLFPPASFEACRR